MAPDRLVAEVDKPSVTDHAHAVAPLAYPQVLVGPLRNGGRRASVPCHAPAHDPVAADESWLPLLPPEVRRVCAAASEHPPVLGLVAYQAPGA